MFRYLVIQVAQLANSCSEVLFICQEAVPTTGRRSLAAKWTTGPASPENSFFL